MAFELKDGSTVKYLELCIGLGFGFQHASGRLQYPVTIVTGDWTLSSDLHWLLCAHMHMNTCKFMHINIFFEKKSLN